MKSSTNFLLLFTLFLVSGSSLLAQKHACKHPVAVSQEYMDAMALRIEPGDTICLLAGKKSKFKIKNFTGSADKPVVITNCGGQVQIGNNSERFGFSVENGRHFKLTGTGSPEHTYGICIDGTGPGASGLSFGSLSTDFEVEFIEVSNTGFAGILSKTDPGCDGKANRGNFVQRNTFFHDNYIHHTHGEGFYIGHSSYGGFKKKCNGEEVIVYPHDIENVAIYNNKVFNTGWDGIQLGCATKEASIYNNHIENFGLRGDYGQIQGIQVSSGTTGLVYNNTIKNGKGTGIFVNGVGDNVIYNNTIINPGGDGIFCDDRHTIPGKGFHFVNNSIIRPGRDGIRMYSTQSKGNTFINNLVVAAGGDYVNKRNNVDWTEATNLFAKEISNVDFEDAANLNFKLKTTSPNFKAGSDVSHYANKFNAKGIIKPISNKFPIGAHPLIAAD
jgi:parallel beta-helix repeat protein